jgi:hypothetical protein
LNRFASDARQPHGLQPTNLTDLCQELRLVHANRLASQRVHLSCEVDADLTFDLPQPLVRQILNAWIDEALAQMPDGGQLDITFVVSAAGLEIEVADSRETDLHETQSYWYRNVQINEGSVVEWVGRTEVRVETALCPQGGVARTVMFAHHQSVNSPAQQDGWRKVA